MENFVIYYLLITIDYFSVAQTTVLIGVNPCLTGSYLKKQSQFRVSYFVCGISYVVFWKNKANLWYGEIDASSYLKGRYGNNPACRARKNKANQSQFGYFTAENAECAEVFDV